MSDIFFSLVGPAIRSDRYQNIFDNLNSSNEIPFEIIFSGHKKPERNMPGNFHYIYTKVKPIQCLEISVRRAIGEYVIFIQDDVVLSPEFLNKMHKHIKNNGDKKVLVSPRYAKGKKYDNSVLKSPLAKVYFDKSKASSPRVGLHVAYKREVWHKLGGLDNRFIGSYGDIDMQMRFFEKGYSLFDALDCCAYEVVKLGDFPRLVKRCNERTALDILNDLWTRKGKILKKRNFPVNSFADKNILIKSQGNKDKSQWD